MNPMGAGPSGSLVDGEAPRDSDRLERFIEVNATATAVAVVMLVIAALLLHSGWLLFLSFCITAVGAIQLGGLRSARAGDESSAVMVLTLTMVLVGLVVTWIAPVAMFVTPLLMVWPSVLAAPYVEPVRLRRLMVVAVVASSAIVALGHLQDGARLEKRAPDWFVDLLIVVFIPMAVALVTLAAQLNYWSLRRRAEELRRSRQRVVMASDGTRRALERDLHDGAQQDLAAAAIQARVLQRTLPGHTDETEGLLRSLHRAREELRRVAHGVFPSVLSDRGPAEAIISLCATSGGRVSLDVSELGTTPPDAASCLYFALVEILEAFDLRDDPGGPEDIERSAVTGRIETTAEELRFRLTVRGADAGPDLHRLVQAEDRIGAQGGQLVVDDRTDGLTLSGRIPFEAETEARGANLDPSAVKLIIVSSAASLLVPIVVYIFLVRNAWLLVIAAMIAETAALFLAARRRLGRGDGEGAVRLLILGAWTYAPMLTALLPILLVYTPLLLLLPVLVGVPIFRAEHLRPLTIGVVTLSVVTVILGRTRDWTGLEAELPSWALTLLLLAVVPNVIGVLMSFAWDNHTRLQARADELSRSRRRLITAADAARSDLARDVERTVSPHLADAGRRLGELRARRAVLVGVVDGEAGVGEFDAIHETIDEARLSLDRLSHGLYPATLEREGLAMALAQVGSRSHGRVQVEADLTDLGSIPDPLAVGVYFCCSEAITNAVKHAGDAARIVCRLWVRDGHLGFEVADDGCGFEPRSIVPGYGMNNLADRFSDLGGDLTIRSAPGEGTVVRGLVGWAG